MGLIAKIRAYARTFRQRRRDAPMDLNRLLRRRPLLLCGVSAFEMAQFVSSKLDTRLKMLAEIKTSTLIGCEFCMDIGSALSRAFGIRDEQLYDLSRYQTSAAFNELERLVLDYSVAVSKTPTDTPVDLLEKLRRHLDEAQLVELASAIAWEHYRARFNQALGVRPAGFSEGAFCVLPERDTPPPAARADRALGS